MTQDRQEKAVAVNSIDVPPRAKPSIYPAPFAPLMAGREKRQLGEFFGIKNFGVNMTHLKPNSKSALLHKHKTQDEFVFIIEGEPTLITDNNETQMKPGMCAGFPAGGVAHMLVNRTENDVFFLEIGDRTSSDEVTYPNEDLKGVMQANGQWVFTHKDGTPY